MFSAQKIQHLLQNYVVYFGVFFHFLNEYALISEAIDDNIASSLLAKTSKSFAQRERERNESIE